VHLELPPRREHRTAGRMPVPAQPAPAARARKKAITEQLLDAGRIVAYREQRCLQAPHGPPREALPEDHGEGRPRPDTLTVSSHASAPQPESPKNPTLTANDTTRPSALILGGG
jgi:hypothetical protein